MINILINCTSKFNLNARSLKMMGGIETLSYNLAMNLSKENYNITLFSLTNRQTGPWQGRLRGGQPHLNHFVYDWIL